MKDYATVIDVKTASVEAVYQEDFYALTPAVTSHEYQQGKAYFIGARLEDQFQRDFYEGLITDLSLSPVFPVQHGKGVSVQARQDQDNDYIFVMNFTEEKQLVTFDQSVKDIMTGDILSGDLTMEKYEVRIVVNTH